MTVGEVPLGELKRRRRRGSECRCVIRRLRCCGCIVLRLYRHRREPSDRFPNIALTTRLDVNWAAVISGVWFYGGAREAQFQCTEHCLSHCLLAISELSEERFGHLEVEASPGPSSKWALSPYPICTQLGSQPLAHESSSSPRHLTGRINLLIL